MRLIQFLHFTALAFLCVASSAMAQQKKDSVRVLFIGNSYTHYHEMPKMVQSVAANVAMDYRFNLFFKMLAPGGCTLKKHWQTPDEIAEIKKGGWDYVILQEYSSAPARPTNEVCRETYPYAHSLDSLVLRYNPKAKVIFYMTWGHKDGCQVPITNYPIIDTYIGMQDRLMTSYLEMAYANNAWCAPVGMAWKRIRNERPYLPLYWPDGSHPSVLGSYLVANVIFATIFQKPYQTTYLCGFEPELAEYIQQVAQQTVFNNKKLLNLEK